MTMLFLSTQIHLISFFLIISLLSGCATTGGNIDRVETQQRAAAEEAEANIDPFENVNRAIYWFNGALDKVIIRPIAKGYKNTIPQPIRTGISNFFVNLLEPTTTVNALLQGKPKEASQSLGRFLVNSTVGVVGIFDVARSLDIPKYEEDFGQTFAVWGAGPGPYIMLPFLGPSNLRDFTGTVTRHALTDVTGDLDADAAAATTAVGLLDTRSKLLGLDETLNLQIDPYAFIRESYSQARLKAIHDGQLLEAEKDQFEEELFDN